jgi:hypothetical protein
MAMSTSSVSKPKIEHSRAASVANEKRRGVRMNSRVPVSIEWEDSQGRRVRAKAYTCVVNPYGCLVVLPENLAIDEQVVVINMVSEETLSGTIVSRGSLRDEGWELGIELRQPPADFWGLDL